MEADNVYQSSREVHRQPKLKMADCRNFETFRNVHEHFTTDYPWKSPLNFGSHLDWIPT